MPPGTQIHIPRTYSQPVSLVPRLPDPHLRPEVEVLNQPTDYDGLLDVLLAKVDVLGGADIKQLHAHSHDAAEEDGPRRALKQATDRRDSHEAAAARQRRVQGQRWVYDLGRRREDGGDSPPAGRTGELGVEARQLRHVGVPGLWVGV